MATKIYYKLQCRHPGGTIPLEDLDADMTWAALKQLICEKTHITVDSLKVLSGYPPKEVSDGLEVPLLKLPIRNGTFKLTDSASPTPSAKQKAEANKPLSTASPQPMKHKGKGKQPPKPKKLPPPYPDPPKRLLQPLLPLKPLVMVKPDVLDAPIPPPGTYFTHLPPELRRDLKKFCANGMAVVLSFLGGFAVSKVEYRRARRGPLCSLAAEVGNLKLLQWAREKGCLWRIHGRPWKGDTAYMAAKKGHSEVFKWALANGCPVDSGTYDAAAEAGNLLVMKILKESGLQLRAHALDTAAYHGKLDVLRWAGLAECKEAAIVENAALGGQMEVVAWAIKQGLPITDYSLANAALKGDLKILQLLHKEWQKMHVKQDLKSGESPFLLTPHMSANAIRGGHWEVFEWCRANNFPWKSPLLCEAAAEKGRLDWLQKLRKEGCPAGKEICSAAADTGQLEILKWARAKNLPWDEGTLYTAAFGGHFEVIKWALEEGCPGDSICNGAALEGHLDILQYAREKGCPWGRTALNAAQNGHLGLLQWAHKHGCPVDGNVAAMAAQDGYDEVFTWVLMQGVTCSTEPCASFAAIGDVELLSWARKNNCPWNEDACLYAASNGSLETLRWAREHGCPWKPEDCLARAQAHGHKNVVQWIRENRHVKW